MNLRHPLQSAPAVVGRMDVGGRGCWQGWGEPKKKPTLILSSFNPKKLCMAAPRINILKGCPLCLLKLAQPLQNKPLDHVLEGKKRNGFIRSPQGTALLRLYPGRHSLIPQLVTGHLVWHSNAEGPRATWAGARP